MSRRTIIGKCRICGSVGPLTYEHIPPESAFNDQSVLEPNRDLIIGRDTIEYLDNRKGRTNQRGVGGYTLCGDCNSKTGSWYVPAFTDFSHALYPMCAGLEVYKSGWITLKIKPLNILKQIMTMFCSVNSERYAEVHPEMIRFILNQENRALPDKFRISIALYNLEHSVVLRSTGIASSMDMNNGRLSVFSEISFPPLILMLDVGQYPVDERLTNITWFKNYNYNEVRSINLILKSLPISTPVGNFLTETELRALYTDS
ncbi:hypothetical protein ABC766_12920 [Methylobacterium fujisawaense]|uniref:hypothetical protein n=1 Tax=Methylobacterium fujisawaense TaxID=107400 RepID=UPI0031F5697E